MIRMTDLTFELADGRMLGYALYGPETGQKVFYLHGTPSSRLEPQLLNIWGKRLAQLLQQYNLQLIAVDRPGMGLSSFDNDRSYTSVAADALALLQHLGVQSCPVLCWSGGGPYALTLAQQFPQVVTTVCIIAGISSSFGNEDVYAHMGWNKLYFNTARQAPMLLQGTFEAIKRTTLSTPPSQSLYDLSNVDYALVKDVDSINQLLELTIKEALHTDNKGAVQEAQLYFEPLPYTLSEIRVPVHFWWGTEDNVVTYIHAKNMERQLPHVTPHYKAGEGHLSIYVNYFEEVLQVLRTAF